MSESEAVKIQRAVQSAVLKWRRGVEHLQDIDRRAGWLTQMSPATVGVHVEPSIQGGINVALEVRQEVPPDLTLMFGDAAHNLRSALDHLAAGLVNAKAGRDSKHVYFPFGKTEDNLERSGRTKPIADALPELWPALKAVAAPYKTDELGLWHLNKLDVTDKHRVIVVNFGVSSVVLDIIFGNGGIFQDNMIQANGVGRFYFAQFPPPVRVTAVKNPTFGVYFSEAATGGPLPVVDTLEVFAGKVHEVITTAERHLGFVPDEQRVQAGPD